MQNENDAEIIRLRDIVSVVKRNFGIILITILSCAILGVLTAIYLPHKYKSKAVLNIQHGYFQNPLVSDLISEVHDPSELTAQRLSLLRLALSQEFLDSLGEKYRVYKYSANHPLRSFDREEFLKKIEYFSVSPTSFQISIVADNPRTAFNIAQDVLGQMTFTLIEVRYQTLMKARQAILKQAKLLNKTLLSGAATPHREVLEAQLRRMENQLTALRARFTDNHPSVLKAKGGAQAIKLRLEGITASESNDEYTNVFLSPASRASTQDIFDDLLKKLSHLNVVLEMERDRENVSYLAVIEQPVIPVRAFFPDRMQFGLIGALCGLIIAGIRITFEELKKADELSPEQASLTYNFEVLGELPPLREKGRALFLEPPNRKVIPLLPRSSA